MHMMLVMIEIELLYLCINFIWHQKIFHIVISLLKKLKKIKNVPHVPKVKNVTFIPTICYPYYYHLNCCCVFRNWHYDDKNNIVIIFFSVFVKFAEFHQNCLRVTGTCPRYPQTGEQRFEELNFLYHHTYFILFKRQFCSTNKITKLKTNNY